MTSNKAATQELAHNDKSKIRSSHMAKKHKELSGKSNTRCSPSKGKSVSVMKGKARVRSTRLTRKSIVHRSPTKKKNPTRSVAKANTRTLHSAAKSIAHVSPVKVEEYSALEKNLSVSPNAEMPPTDELRCVITRGQNSCDTNKSLSQLLLTNPQDKKLSIVEHTPPPFPAISNDSPINISSSPGENSPLLWIAKLDLYQNDKHILESTHWINDGIMFAAQSLLSTQSKGKIFGWQSTQLSKTEALFKPIPPRAPFVQMLHISECHWSMVSNIDVQLPGNCHADIVGIYDSSRPHSVSLHTKKMVCSFYKCQTDALHFDIINIESQPNSYDCGVFAIANATELVFGGDPATCRWDCGRMRAHLKDCLETGVMKKFPKKSQRRVPFGSRTRSTFLERVYCTCRMPNDKEKAMIKCDDCQTWFHEECMNLSTVISYTKKKWVCDKCQHLSEKLTLPGKL